MCESERERELCGCVYIYEYIHVLLIALYHQDPQPQPHLASPPTSNSFECARPGMAPGLAGLWKMPGCCQDGFASVHGDDNFGQLLVSERHEERSPWVMAMVSMNGLQGPVDWGFRDHHRPHIVTGNCPECFKTTSILTGLLLDVIKDLKCWGPGRGCWRPVCRQSGAALLFPMLGPTSGVTKEATPCPVGPFL